MSELLIESALLTHGLRSITNEELKHVFLPEWKIAWMENGEVIVGDILQFLPFRDRAKDYKRINYFNFDKCLGAKYNGALTASGTMRVCERLQIPLVVTCGIGGLVEMQTIESCNDLKALSISKVSMLATAFKDMFDENYTIKMAENHGIQVFGKDRPYGYLFENTEGMYDHHFDDKECIEPHTLYLNPILISNRIKDARILKDAVEYGREQEKNGKYFHPAVNGYIDSVTEGESSRIQLEALIRNIRLGASMHEL